MFNYATQEFGRIRTSQTLRQQMGKNSKIQTEINPNKKREKKRVSKFESCFIEISKINRPLAPLTRRKKDMTQINQIGDAQENIVTNTKESQSIIQEHFKNICSIKLEI